MAQMPEMNMRVSVDPEAMEELVQAREAFDDSVREVNETVIRLRNAVDALSFAFKVTPDKKQES